MLKSLRKAGPAGRQGAAGPKGSTGSAGANGTNGTNGAVAAYHAGTGSSPVSLTDAAGKTVISKTLPAGSYVVNADLSIDAQQLNASAGVAVFCTLNWSGGTESEAYVSPWNTADDDTANGAIVWNLAGTVSSQSTVTITCSDDSAPGSGTDINSASISTSADITAVQASSVS